MNLIAKCPLTKWRSSQSLFQGLGHGQVAPVGEGCLNQLVLHAQVFKAVVEVGVGHVNGQLLQHVRLLGVEVEPHLGQPVKGPGVVDLVVEKQSSSVALVHQLSYLWEGEKEDMAMVEMLCRVCV